MRSPVRFAIPVAVAGTVLTLLVFSWARQIVLRSFRTNFEADVSVRARLVLDRLEEARLVVRSLRNAVGRSGGVVDAARFRRLVPPFRTDEFGLAAVVWLPASPRGNDACAPGEGGIAVLPEGAGRDGSPFDPLPPGLLSSPSLSAALAHARDTGKEAAAGRVPLEGRGGGTAIAVASPVYSVEEPIASVELRQATLRGHVVAFLLPSPLLVASFRETSPIGLPFDLVEYPEGVSEGGKGSVIVHWTARLPGPPTLKAALFSSQEIEVRRFRFAEREWGIEVAPNLGYLALRHPVGHWGILPAGLLVSLVLAVYAGGEIRARERLQGANRVLEGEVAERKRLEEEHERTIGELRDALASIRKLEGILPICSSCKRIRDDQGNWNQIESYISDHSGAGFSHGICPECTRKLYGDYVAPRRGDSP